ncbi:hypothetical protein GGQ80_002232 [Sphingomonas jinjuensis]|jgi:hypothetical protein|uniref:Type 1 capsular polysaccharide biosynthesis protein J n=1 Tax=Sphingomonas jinjuensis TaxID=535907 RepID=A0A840F9G3_9SPHN|nr:DUF6356 family protein [Sphingomonas jinjuensis]MBB4154319.1 hypothetical protein [Sphingomonas jinjuensis]
MIDHLLLAHPRSVGESYTEHARVASGIGFAMIGGGLACLVHAVVPAWHTRTGSNVIKRLYARLMSRQPAFASQTPAFAQPAWQLEYEI